MKFLIASDLHGSLESTKLLLQAFEKEKADKLILAFPDREELENIDCEIPFLYTTYPELEVLNNDEDKENEEIT